MRHDFYSIFNSMCLFESHEINPSPPRVTGVRGTQEAKVPMRAPELIYTQFAERRHGRIRHGGITYTRGGLALVNIEIQEYFHRTRPFYMVRKLSRNIHS